MKKAIAAFAIVAAVLSGPGTAFSDNKYLRFCGKWSSRYTDSGVGEDSFTSSSTLARPAQYAYSTIYDVVAGPDPVEWGHWMLDEDGCTDWITVEVGHNYRFRMRTMALYDGTRRIFVQDQDATSWGTSYPGCYIIHDFYYQSKVYDPTNIQINVTATKSWETNVAAIAGKIWDRKQDGTIQIPSPMDTFVRQDDEYSYEDDYRVFVGGDDTAVKKFVASHEIGHAVGDRLADMHGSSYGASKPYSLCSCNHIGGSCSHCLQSREYIRDAENEGWAHFFSTAVFNNRTSANGWFGYYKDINYAYPESDCTTQPCEIDVTDDRKWMETYCSTGSDDMGVEWDWLTFFWGLWTEDATYRYSMTEIANVWDEVHDVEAGDPEYEDWYWDDLVQAADNLYSDSKRQEFEDQGTYSGVDH